MSRSSSSSPESTPPDEPTAARPARPLGVYIITAVLALEAAALAFLGVWFTLGVLGQQSASLGSAIFLAVLLFALAAALTAVSVNAFRGYRWTRSAAFVWQLLMAAIGVPALLSGAIPVGLLLLVPAVAAVYFLFTPTVVAYSLRTTGDQPTL